MLLRSDSLESWDRSVPHCCYLCSYVWIHFQTLGPRWLNLSLNEHPSSFITSDGAGHSLGCLGFTNLVLDVTWLCLGSTVTGALVALSQLLWSPAPPPLPGSAPSS